METGAERKALNNINYSSNYDEIFEIDSSKLNDQTSLIDNKLDMYLDSNLSSETDYRDGIDKFFQDDGIVYGISSPQLNDMLSMVNFDILKSSLTLLPSSRNHFF